MAFYLLVGGRVYCAWVCPVNIVTDAAHWLRERLGIVGAARLSPNDPLLDTGCRHCCWRCSPASLVWELVNPVSMLHRGLIFGMGSGLAGGAGGVPARPAGQPAWPGAATCVPMGAFYSAARHAQPGAGARGPP